MGWLVVLPSLIRQHGGSGYDRLDRSQSQGENEEVGEAVRGEVVQCGLPVMIVIIRSNADNLPIGIPR